MARWPTGPFSTRRTGCYGCKRMTSADGGCGVHGYPCTHWGVDMFPLLPTRDVFAPEASTVVAVAPGTAPPWSGYGPMIVLLKGASGFYHLLAHLELGSTKVMPGMTIAEGTFVGRFDTAYNHTHYEVRIKPTGPSNENTVDPNKWLADHGGGGGIGTLLVLGGLLAAGYFLARSRTFAKLV